MIGKYIWNAADIPGTEIEKTMRLGACSKAIAVFLAAKGIRSQEDINAYFKPSLSMLGDPFVLPGVEKAAERIWSSIHAKESILVFGDYDTDGVTASALLYEVLRDNGGIVSCFLPHRFDDGYGMTTESLGKALDENPAKLIITVDCGISAREAVELASSKGIDVIISDHHEPPDQIPKAHSVIDPKLHPELGHLHILAGVGVAFKLAHGFIKYGKTHSYCGDEHDLRKDLDLVALGTVADLVPLVGENRIMVSSGLKRLSEQIRPGINALCERSNIMNQVRSSDITYSLSPRINAAGRLKNAATAFKMLIERDRTSATRYADEINKLNAMRHETEAEITQQAHDKLGDVGDRASIVVYGADWNVGVIGIVSSKLAREYNRPTIIFSVQNGTAYGSARSVDNINILELLSHSSHLLERFGGHAMAAGLSIKSSRLEEFKESFEKSAMERTSSESRIPHLALDGTASLSDINTEFFDMLPRLEPFGYGNSSPVFRINRLHIKYASPAAQVHSRGVLADDFDRELQFIAFNCNCADLHNIGLVDVAASPQLNTFRGRTSPQLQILDFKHSGGK